MVSELKDILKEARNRLNLSQEKLADQLGVDEKTIRNWESGKCTPNPSLVSPLISALNLNKNEFDALYMKAIHIEDSTLFPDKKNTPPEFPDFLFPDDEYERCKEAYSTCFTEDEQELIAMKYLYSFDFHIPIPVGEYHTGDGQWGIKSERNVILPYEYVLRKGIYNVINTNASLEGKMDNLRASISSILDVIRKEPRNLFATWKLSTKEQIKFICPYWLDVLEQIITEVKAISKHGNSVAVPVTRHEYSECEIRSYESYISYRTPFYESNKNIQDNTIYFLIDPETMYSSELFHELPESRYDAYGDVTTYLLTDSIEYGYATIEVKECDEEWYKEARANSATDARYVLLAKLTQKGEVLCEWLKNNNLQT